MLTLNHSAFAQVAPPESSENEGGLEELYDKYETDEGQKAEKRRTDNRMRQDQQGLADKEITKLSELAELAPFEDVAVIQKRFLPKTGRFEFSGSAMVSTNNQYFNTMGLGGRLSYFFSEKYGIEGTYQTYINSERPITDGLVDNQNISTKSLVEPESYYGVAFKWSPLYGKIAWFQKTIIPFDLYFTPGFGVTTDKSGPSASTYSIGVGQLFALSKSFGVRWDFNWNFYQAEIKIKNDSGGLDTTTQNHSDLFLGIGLSFFFPEATYR